MSATLLPAEVRQADYFQHIDMGFLNRRLCLTALPGDGRRLYAEHAKVGSDHTTVLSNDHLLVTMLLDACIALRVPTLLEVIALGKPRHLFCSTERLAPCPAVYTDPRVVQEVILNVDVAKPVQIAYHTEHIVSSTGKMTLAEGAAKQYVESMVGLLHDKGDKFEIEPLVMGAPWLEHPRNGPDSEQLMWFSRDYGEILPEDIDQFAKMKDITTTTDEWMPVMRSTSEQQVKEAFAQLLGEPTKADWGGETNDHYSANIVVGGRRRTAAFLLKGPSQFREMTPDMCGKRADQIYRLAGAGADISVVQHAHLIGEAVRETVRAFTVHPGRPRKFCIIDGQATFRILRAHGFV